MCSAQLPFMAGERAEERRRDKSRVRNRSKNVTPSVYINNYYEDGAGAKLGG